MRIGTVLSVAVLGISTAALAQVANRTPPQNGASANAPAANEVVEDKVPPAAPDTPAANAADAAPPPGEPDAATSAPPRG